MAATDGSTMQCQRVTMRCSVKKHRQFPADVHYRSLWGAHSTGLPDAGIRAVTYIVIAGNKACSSVPDSRSALRRTSWREHPSPAVETTSNR